MKSWEKQVEMYKEGQRLLERQRFQFPSTWLYSDNVDGEWSAFSDIIRRKDSSIQTQVASLQMKVISEDKVVESRTGELLTEWEKEKPVEVGYLYYYVYLNLSFAIESYPFCRPNCLLLFIAWISTK